MIMVSNTETKYNVSMYCIGNTEYKIHQCISNTYFKCMYLQYCTALRKDTFAHTMTNSSILLPNGNIHTLCRASEVTTVWRYRNSIIIIIIIIICTPMSSVVVYKRYWAYRLEGHQKLVAANVTLQIYISSVDGLSFAVHAAFRRINVFINSTYRPQRQGWLSRLAKQLKEWLMRVHC